MVGLHWQVYGEDVVNRELLRFEERHINAMPVFAAIVKDIEDAVGNQFGSEGVFASGGWAPLKESTLAEKAAHGYPLTILHRTLDLLRSFVDENHTSGVREVDPYGFVFGSMLDYARYHQEGTVNMPARPPLEFREADKVLWLKRIQRYLVTGELGVEDVL